MKVNIEKVIKEKKEGRRNSMQDEELEMHCKGPVIMEVIGISGFGFPLPLSPEVCTSFIQEHTQCAQGLQRLEDSLDSAGCTEEEVSRNSRLSCSSLHVPLKVTGEGIIGIFV